MCIFSNLRKNREKTAGCIQNLKTLNILVNLWSLQDQVYQISSLFVENCLQGVNGGNISCRDRRSGSFYLDENLGSVVFLCFFFSFLFFYIYQSLLKLKTCQARFSFLLTIGLSDPQGVLSLFFSYICLCFQKINPSQLALFPSLLTIGFYSHPTMSTLPNLHYLHSIYQYLKAYIKAYLKAFVRRIWNHPSRTTPNPPPVNLQLWYGYIYPQLPKQYPIWAVLHE